MQKVIIDIESENPDVLDRIRGLFNGGHGVLLTTPTLGGTKHYTKVEAKTEDGTSVYLSILAPTGIGPISEEDREPES